MEYRPAELKKGKRWYIHFYQTDPESMDLIRHRMTYNLNRIKDKEERLRVALAKIEELNTELLPAGYPYKIKKQKEKIFLEKAIDIAYQAKLNDRKNSNKSYTTVYRFALKHIRDKDWEEMEVRQFVGMHAFDLMQAVGRKSKSARTYNNYRGFYVTMWNELVRRDLIDINPFVAIPRKRVNEKKRRTFSDYEQKIVIDKIKEVNQDYMMVIYLIYYCLLRPGEIRKLRVGDLNLIKSIIIIPGYISKNRKIQSVTIPEIVIPFFANHVKNSKDSDYLIAHNYRPGKKMLGQNTLYNFHKEILHSVKKEINIKGLTLYSWKDTGGSELARKVSIVEVQRQFRHSELRTTQKYLSGFGEVNQEILKYRGKIL